MTHADSTDLFFFTEEELAWEDEPPRAAPSAPPAPRPRPARRRTQTRTLAGDLGRVRLHLAAHQPSTRSSLALFLVLAALLGVLLLTRNGPGGGDGPAALEGAARPQAQAAGATPTAPSLPAARSDPVLRPGSTDPAVRGLQEALYALELTTGTPDGVFGPATRAALSQLQRARGLTPDGVLGPETSGALRDALVEHADAAAATVREGLEQAVAAGRLEPGAAGRHRAVLDAAVAELGRLPVVRGAYVALVLDDLAFHAPVFDGPRAVVLFGMLEANVRHVAKRKPPSGAGDMEDEHGVVYRLFPSHGFQFHPLASFVRLNALAGKGRREEARRLATALGARAVPLEGAVTWEYYFPFRGPPRWTSGLAQAVSAQALARTGALLAEPAFSKQAEAAFRAVPAAFVRPLAGGLWIREYEFSDTAILNAQLQTVVSLSEYAATTGDRRAHATVERLADAAGALLHRFDNGCWSLYALDGAPASLAYHTYHVSLLEKLAKARGEPVWREIGRRWEIFLRAASGSAPPACG